MANHGFVTTRKHLTGEKVDADLRVIVNRRFGNDFVVEYIPHWEQGGWKIKPSGDSPWFFEFTLWLAKRGTLEFRHPRSGWAYWAQQTIQDELAILYNGTISDEGVFEKWKVKKIEYPTYESWFKMLNSHLLENYKELYEARLKSEFEFLPEILRKY